MYYSLNSDYLYCNSNNIIQYKNSLNNINTLDNKYISYIPFIYLGTIESNNSCKSGNYPNILNYYINTYIKDISWSKFKSLFYSTDNLFNQNYTEISSNYYYNFDKFIMFNNCISGELSLYTQIINSYKQTANVFEFPSMFYTELQKFYSIHQNIFSLVNCNISNILTYQELYENIQQLQNKNEFLLVITLVFYPPNNYQVYNNIPLNTITLNLSYRVIDYK